MGEKPSAMPVATSGSSQATGPVRARRGRHALPFCGLRGVCNLFQVHLAAHVCRPRVAASFTTSEGLLPRSFS